MASNKRNQTSSQGNSDWGKAKKKPRKDADSQDEPTDFEMELALLEEEDMIFSQESTGQSCFFS